MSKNMFFNLFHTIPLYTIFIFTFLSLFLAFKGGVFLGKKHQLIAEPKDRSPINSIVAATLGLLAFLLAFTFGIAASKFDERRTLVVEEANAIRTTYLRADYLPELHRNEIKNLLKEYISVRIASLSPKNFDQTIKKSEDLQDKLWLQTVTVAEKNPNSVIVGLFIESLNELISLHAKRLNIGIRIRIPFIIWCVLYFVTILAIGSVGYQIGLINARYLGINALLILIFSTVIVLIADLDRPQEGFIKVSQQSLIDLIDKFNKHEN
ncbi:MAG: hypothetical protein Q8K60_08260 [Parachlamydiaceae bacterium]|nr:hypothetical protein [Parachlamydiaceae bacterium]